MQYADKIIKMQYVPSEQCPDWLYLQRVDSTQS